MSYIILHKKNNDFIFYTKYINLFIFFTYLASIVCHILVISLYIYIKKIYTNNKAFKTLNKFHYYFDR